jgi:hypothetical protein
MRNFTRIATSSLVLTSGLGLAGLGAAAVAEAQPIAPPPAYHWCPGDRWDGGWGSNWDWGRCHDDHFWDGDYRDRDHWHNGDYDDHWQGGPGDRDHWQGGPGDRDHWQGGPPGDRR